MVRACEHPDFEIEEKYLQDTLGAIRRELAGTHQSREATLVYRNAYVEGRRLTDEEASNLQTSLAVPYFSRVDFIRASTDSTRPVYIGKFGVKGSNGSYLVHNWQAPIAQLYYKQQWQGASYKGPKGNVIQGSILLRRNYKISSSHLDEIIDVGPSPDVLIQSPSEYSDLTDKTEVFVSPVMEDVLAQPRSAKLQDIVATIQPEQYSLIEAPLRGVLVVQGVAGSGKTSLALHRVAYLLYHHRETIAANRMLVIGPSAVFLRSVSEILPDLGVRGIPQMTFTDWALAWLGGNLRVESRSIQMEHLIDPAYERHVGRVEHRLLGVAGSFLYRFKGSMRMASLLRAHVAATKKSLPSQARTIDVTYMMPEERGVVELAYTRSDNVSLSISAEETGRIVKQTLAASASDGLRLGVLRDRCVDAIIDSLWQRFQNMPVYDRPHQFRKAEERQEWETRDVKRASAFRAAIKEAVRSAINGWWPTVTPVNCYRSLLASRDRLARAASEATEVLQTVVNEWELELLYTPEAQKRDYAWQEEDLAPLCYTALILNGPREERYDHVVIDEVQEISPLELYLLYQHAVQESMTLVGDVAQGLGWSGIRTLSDLDGTLDGVSITYAIIDTSYRSTYEITVFASRLLGQLPSSGINGLAARPVSRHGPEPELVACSSRRQLLAKSADIVIDAQKRGSQSIAVICKTSAEAQEVADAFRSRRVPVVAVESHHDAVLGGVVVVPAYLAKGLEFDTVLVVDADDTTYTQKEYDARLLYVAVTRALHRLHVLWTGTVTPLLA